MRCRHALYSQRLKNVVWGFLLLLSREKTASRLSCNGACQKMCCGTSGILWLAIRGSWMLNSSFLVSILWTWSRRSAARASSPASQHVHPSPNLTCFVQGYKLPETLPSTNFPPVVSRVEAEFALPNTMVHNMFFRLNKREMANVRAMAFLIQVLGSSNVALLLRTGRTCRS